MTQPTQSKTREERISDALTWYTSPPQSLLVTPINYPTPSEEDPRQGMCSCGSEYRVDENGVQIKAGEESGLDPAKSCPSAGKHPVRKHYIRDPANHASTPEQARELWGGRPWNIGVIHGQNAGLVVFDVDVRADGLSSMTKLSEALAEVAPDWELSSTLSYHTSGKSGRGFHLYYRADRDDLVLWRELRAMGETILPGIEVKWKSGVVVAAPSLHASGQVYSISSALPVAELTQERLTQLRTAVSRITGRAHQTASPSAGGSVGWAAMSEAAEAYSATVGVGFGGDLSWQEAKSDSPDNPGYWSRQLSYLLITGTPAQQFGKGNHHDPLKSLIGAAAKIVFAKESFAREVGDVAIARAKTEPLWIPAVFGSLVFDIDSAVCVPQPWQVTDRNNLLGIARYSMLQELRTHGVEI